MKLLGRFYLAVANEYQELLDKEDITISIEKKPVSYHAVDILVDVFVPEESYDKAVGIIKDFEMKNEIEVKEDSREASRSMFYIFMVFILIFVVSYYILKLTVYRHT